MFFEDEFDAAIAEKYNLNTCTILIKAKNFCMQATRCFSAVVRKVGENEKTGARLSAVVFSNLMNV